MVTKHEQDCQERFKKVCPLSTTFEGQRECVQNQLGNKQQYTKVLHKCYNQYLSLTSKAYQEARASERKTSPTPLLTSSTKEAKAFVPHPQVKESFDCQAEKSRLQQRKTQLEQDLQAINQQTAEVQKKCLLIEQEVKTRQAEDKKRRAEAEKKLVFDQPPSSPEQARAKYEQANYQHFKMILGQIEADIIGGKHLPAQKQWVEQKIAEGNIINKVNSSLLSDNSSRELKSKIIDLLEFSEKLDYDYQKSMAESEKAVKAFKKEKEATRILEPIEAAEIKIKKHRPPTAKQIAAQEKSKEYIQKAKNYIDNWERNHSRKWKDVAKLNLFQVAKLMQKYYDVYDPDQNSFLTENLTQYGDYKDAYTDLIEKQRDRKLSRKMMDQAQREIMKGPSRKQLQEIRTDQILEKHLERPIEEQLWDEEEEAAKIFPNVTKEAYDRWMKNPMTYDIEGIDVHLSETDKLKREDQRQAKKEKQEMQVKHESAFPWVIIDRANDKVMASYPTQKEAQGEFEKLNTQIWKHSGELELIFNG